MGAGQRAENVWFQAGQGSGRSLRPVRGLGLCDSRALAVAAAWADVTCRGLRSASQERCRLPAAVVAFLRLLSCGLRCAAERVRMSGVVMAGWGQPEMLLGVVAQKEECGLPKHCGTS